MVDAGAAIEATTANQDQDSATSSKNVILAILSAAMFIYVIDTTIVNVSISALVKDLGTTVEQVQAAITLYTLVRAIFMGTKRASAYGTLFGVAAAGAALATFIAVFGHCLTGLELP